MDHIYCHQSENTKIFQPKFTMTAASNAAKNNNNNAQTPPPDLMSLMKENNQLKSMLLLHLNLIQEQSDMLVSKDKQISVLKQEHDQLKSKLDLLERKLALPRPIGSTLNQQQHENTNMNLTLPLQGAQLGNRSSASGVGIVPTSISSGGVVVLEEKAVAGKPLKAMGSVAAVRGQLCRGGVMKMAPLQSGPGGLGNYPNHMKSLILSLKQQDHPQLIVATADTTTTTSQTEQPPYPMSEGKSENGVGNVNLTSLHGIQVQTNGIRTHSLTPTAASSPRQLDPPVYTNGGAGDGLWTVGSEMFSIRMNNSAESTPMKSAELVIVHNETSPVLELKIEDDAGSDSDIEESQPILMGDQRLLAKPPVDVTTTLATTLSKLSPKTEENDNKLEDKIISIQAPSNGSLSRSNAPNGTPSANLQQHLPRPPSTSTWINIPQRDTTTTGTQHHHNYNKRSPPKSPVYHRLPRKFSRVMSTRKLYVTRHWEEEEQEEDPNSLAVTELKEGEANLEVPMWIEIDSRGENEEVLVEDVLPSMANSEDLSEAAFLKRHAKHEADERRRKKWDIQRFREQKTIEKLKKRHCKSDNSGVNLGIQGGCQSQPPLDDPQSVPFPMSLYPHASSIRHIETTDHLPVQAFGEAVPTLPPAEFSLPWRSDGGGGSVEWIQGRRQSHDGSGGLAADSNSKYSSFYVKQNSNSVASTSSSSYPGGRISGGGGASKQFRHKRIKSQNSGVSGSSRERR